MYPTNTITISCCDKKELRKILEEINLIIAIACSSIASIKYIYSLSAAKITRGLAILGFGSMHMGILMLAFVPSFLVYLFMRKRE